MAWRKTQSYQEQWSDAGRQVGEDTWSDNRDSRRRHRSPNWGGRRERSRSREGGGAWRGREGQRNDRDRGYDSRERERDRFRRDRGRDRDHPRDRDREERDSRRHREDREERRKREVTPPPPPIWDHMERPEELRTLEDYSNCVAENMELSEEYLDSSPPKEASIDEYHAEYSSLSGHTGGSTDQTSGDWHCPKCGVLNFKRRLHCYNGKCSANRPDGWVDPKEEGSDEISKGITKHILLRRLDALTTEEVVLSELTQRLPQVANTVVDLKIGRDKLTGTSRGVAYLNFLSLPESSKAYKDLTSLMPPLRIDDREVAVSYCSDPSNPPPKPEKPPTVTQHGYSQQYHSGGGGYTNPNLTEADRANAAAAVAQSAISQLQARTSWQPVAAPQFISKPVVAQVQLPSGDGNLTYPPPDVRTFLYDESSSYYYDPSSGLYYDSASQYFYNNQINQYMYWDASRSTYILASQNQQNTEQPKLPAPPEKTLENTVAAGAMEDKKKTIDKQEKVKVAKKIAKDMERWAKTLNQRKENAKNGIVAEQQVMASTVASSGSADIGFSIIGKKQNRFTAPATLPHVLRQFSPPPEVTPEDFLSKKPATVQAIHPPKQTEIQEDDEALLDWAKLTCLLCKRAFPTMDVMKKHRNLSELHKQNLAQYIQSHGVPDAASSLGYRDRAAERRLKFGEDEPVAPKSRKYEPTAEILLPPVQSSSSVVDTIGGKMLQKMGWSEGKGLGKEEQGRTDPIEAEQRNSLAGLGQKRGIYTAAPGETYRNTVKKLMIARYQDLIKEDDI